MVEDPMSIRPPSLGPNGRWRMRRSEVRHNTAFIAQCVELWDKGFNTKDISSILFEPESVVESATRLGREQRRMNGGTNGESADKKEDDQWT
jgi:hypothetical protein